VADLIARSVAAMIRAIAAHAVVISGQRGKPVDKGVI
jgi:hypothetical protein